MITKSKQNIKVKLKIASKTSTGLVRELNEDYFCINEEKGLYIVADGMGGHDRGDIASQKVSELILEYISNRDYSLEQAIFKAHYNLKSFIQNEIAIAMMGTTVVVTQITGNQYKIGWVGDSRAYLFSNNSLMQLTKDHSFIQDLLDQNKITPKEALYHPAKHLLTNAVGASDEIYVDITEGELEKGESILICTDGLINELNDEEICDILTTQNDLNKQANDLIDYSNLKGGNDNITVLLVKN